MDTYFSSIRECPVGADRRFMAVFNGAGSGKVILVHRVVAVGEPVAAVTGLVVPLACNRIQAAPAGGTVMAVAKAVPADITGGRLATPALPAQVTVLKSRNDANTSDTLITGGTPEPIGFGGGNVSGEETASANESTLYQAPLDGSEPIYCPEGWGFEVRQLTLASAGAIGLVAVFSLLSPAETLTG